MVDDLRLFRGFDHVLKPGLQIHQPCLDEICTYGEQRYWSLVRLICATPADMKVDIWDTQHVFWDQVDEFDWFLARHQMIANQDTSILFGNVGWTFQGVTNSSMELVALRNRDGVIIDRDTYMIMADCIRRVHRISKNTDVGYDDYTKEVMIEDDRDDMLLNRRKPFESQLWPMISALINCPEFKYRWDDVWSLPIGIFMDSVDRVQRHKRYSFLMHGIYNGCVDINKISKQELNWMSAGKQDDR